MQPEPLSFGVGGGLQPVLMGIWDLGGNGAEGGRIWQRVTNAPSEYTQSHSIGARVWCLCFFPYRFEQEVLGAPVTGIPTAMPTVPTVEAMQVPTAPVIRPIIATNTYQQVWLS